MKRFYDAVSVRKEPAGYRVLLDERPIRTQAGGPQIVPTRALAEALAAEWRDQPAKFDPAAFPLRDLADYALDHIAPARDAAIGKLVAFAQTDTLCYRADPDTPLFQLQWEVWEPLVTACEAARGIMLERVSGIVHRAQPEATIAALAGQLEAIDHFTLAGLWTLASLAASLTIALAALDPAADPAALFAAANLEEDWQAEQWGWDTEAEQTRARRLAAFVAAARFLQLARGR